MKYAVETRTCTLSAPPGSTHCGACTSPISKCGCSTGERMLKAGWLTLVLTSVGCPNIFTIFVFVCVCEHYRRFAVCECCTEIDDHLQQATSEEERRLWLRAKKIHREYVSNISEQDLYLFSLTHPMSNNTPLVCRCEPKGECTISEALMLLRPVML